jgi:hypothetical protein
MFVVCLDGRYVVIGDALYAGLTIDSEKALIAVEK